MIFILHQTSSTASGPPSPKGKARAVRIAASCFTIIGNGAPTYRNTKIIVGDGALDVPKFKSNRRGRRPRRTLKNACIFKNMASRNVKRYFLIQKQNLKRNAYKKIIYFYRTVRNGSNPRNRGPVSASETLRTYICIRVSFLPDTDNIRLSL